MAFFLAVKQLKWKIWVVFDKVWGHKTQLMKCLLLFFWDMHAGLRHFSQCFDTESMSGKPITHYCLGEKRASSVNSYLIHLPKTDSGRPSTRTYAFFVCAHHLRSDCCQNNVLQENETTNVLVLKIWLQMKHPLIFQAPNKRLNIISGLMDRTVLGCTQRTRS